MTTDRAVKRLKRDRTDGGDSGRLRPILSEIGNAARHVGAFDLYRHLLDALAGAVDADAGQVMYYSANLIPQYLHSFNTPEEDQRLYQSGYYRLDPFFRYWHDLRKGGVVRLHEIVRTRGSSASYFHNFWPTTAMADELAILLPTFEPGAIGLFVQKKKLLSRTAQARVDLIYPLLEGLNESQNRVALTGTGMARAITGSQVPLAVIDAARRTVWRSAELDRLASSYSYIEDLIRSLSDRPAAAAARVPGGVITVAPLDKDFWIAPGGRICLLEKGEPATAPLDYADAVSDFVPDGFTAKEKEIIRLILLGHPTAGIAGKLGISAGTVRNHRKRIYRKLDITTERELYLGFLRHLTGATG